MAFGRIIKQTGGFYYVYADGRIIECRARGIFRKNKITPLVGDNCEVELTDNQKGFVVGIDERKNFLIRPPVANIDRMLMILSVIDPAPNLLVVDKLLAVAEHKRIDAAIVVTKSDLAPSEQLCEIYRKAGYDVTAVNSLHDSPDEVRSLIEGRLCVLAGNSGVGKSTLLNALEPSLELKTGETSQKLGRGRHTTRVTEIFAVAGGFIADTPGFSSLETIQLELIKKDELQWCFKEFEPFVEGCRFTGCSHTKEKGCAVLGAVKDGKIAPSRHQSYCDMYEEAKLIKDWEVQPQ